MITIDKIAFCSGHISTKQIVKRVGASFASGGGDLVQEALL